MAMQGPPRPRGTRRTQRPRPVGRRPSHAILLGRPRCACKVCRDAAEHPDISWVGLGLAIGSVISCRRSGSPSSASPTSSAQPPPPARAVRTCSAPPRRRAARQRAGRRMLAGPGRRPDSRPAPPTRRATAAAGGRLRWQISAGAALDAGAQRPPAPPRGSSAMPTGSPTPARGRLGCAAGAATRSRGSRSSNTACGSPTKPRRGRRARG